MPLHRSALERAKEAALKDSAALPPRSRGLVPRCEASSAARMHTLDANFCDCAVACPAVLAGCADAHAVPACRRAAHAAAAAPGDGSLSKMKPHKSRLEREKEAWASAVRWVPCISKLPWLAAVHKR
jgi:hypothetical protein